MNEQGEMLDMEHSFFYIAANLTGLTHTNNGNGYLPETMMGDSALRTIDSFFEMTDKASQGICCTGFFAKTTSNYYQGYAKAPENPVLNRVVAAWAALGVEGHDPSMQLTFKESVLEAAQNPANKKALEAWFAHERAKGNGLCADRKTAIQATAKALGLDLK